MYGMHGVFFTYQIAQSMLVYNMHFVKQSRYNFIILSYQFLARMIFKLL